MILVIALHLFFVNTYAQVTIHGKVVAAPTYEPVQGANINIAESAATSLTNSEGKFTITTKSLPIKITISHVGYNIYEQVISQLSDTLVIELTRGKNEVLDNITVGSKYYKKYTANELSSSLRLKGSVMNIPQNIQVINQEIIADQGSYNMTENITRNVSGATRSEASNNLGPNIYMRGGQISTLRNGIDLTPLYRGPVPEDAAIIERVEFLKGPSLFMNNIGDPAGAFNIVTKQPTGKKLQSFQATVGSQDFYRLSADVNGTVGQQKKLWYRLNAMAMKSRSFVDFDYNNRWLIAPVVKYQLSRRTSISAEYMFQKFRYALMSPIVMSPRGFGTLPKNFSTHEKSLPPYEPTDHSGFITLAHSFNNNWNLTVRGAMMRNDNEGFYMWVTGVNSADSSVLLRNPKYDLTRTAVFSQQAFVNGLFKTGNIQHQFLGGIDVNQKILKLDNYITYDTYTDAAGNKKEVYYPLNIDDPVYGFNVPTYRTPGGVENGNTQSNAAYYSFYMMDEIHFLDEKLRLTLGARYTSIHTKNKTLTATTSTKDNLVTPRLGISYSILPEFTVFGLFDKTVIPQAGTTIAGHAIEPLKGQNLEVGLKNNWVNGRWHSTLSFFKLKRSGIVSADPDNLGYQLQVGETSAKGMEADIIGQVAKDLNLSINYAYNDAKVDDDINKTLINKPTGLSVRHVQNTWLNYEFPSHTLLKKLSVSMGYQYQGKRAERFTTAAPKPIPDYFRIDGGLGWTAKKVKINLIVNNILNKKLMGTSWYRSGLYYWVPQSPAMGRITINYTL